MQVLRFKPAKLDILGMPEDRCRVQKDFELREGQRGLTRVVVKLLLPFEGSCPVDRGGVCSPLGQGIAFGRCLQRRQAGLGCFSSEPSTIASLGRGSVQDELLNHPSCCRRGL